MFRHLNTRKTLENSHLTTDTRLVKALLDGELFLPESWGADRDRCRAADIPDDMGYQSKWRIGLDLLGRAGGNGWVFDWLTFDEGYGGKPGFTRSGRRSSHGLPWATIPVRDTG